MFLDLGRVLSFFLSIVSLFSMMHGAFFVTATTWQERLVSSISHVVLAACVCCGSGLLFRQSTHPTIPLARTLPVLMFLWTLGAAIILFPLAWVLDTYYVPLLWRNQPWVF
jgi:hypothetical protein